MSEPEKTGLPGDFGHDNLAFTCGEGLPQVVVPLQPLCPAALVSLGASNDEKKVDLDDIPVLVIGEPPPDYEEAVLQQQEEEENKEGEVDPEDPWAVLDEASAFKPWSGKYWSYSNMSVYTNLKLF